MQGNRIFLSIAAVLAGTVACAQGSYTALKFKTATSLYNYEMLPVHTQNYERQQVFEKACQSKAAMLQYVRRIAPAWQTQCPGGGQGERHRFYSRENSLPKHARTLCHSSSLSARKGAW